MKTKFKNVRIGTYGQYETLEERDKRICKENGEPYEPSEITELVSEHTIKNEVKTDFNSLKSFAKDLYDEGYDLIIEPDGTLLIFNSDY